MRRFLMTNPALNVLMAYLELALIGAIILTSSMISETMVVRQKTELLLTEALSYAWRPSDSGRIALPLYADESWPTWRPGHPENFYEAIGIAVEEEAERMGWFYAALPKGYTAKTWPDAPNSISYLNELGLEVFTVYDHLEGPLISVGDRYRIQKEAKLLSGITTIEWPYASMSDPERPKTIEVRYTVVDVKTGRKLFATGWVEFTPNYHLPMGGEFLLEHFVGDDNAAFDSARDETYKFMEDSGYWPQGNTDKTLADWGVESPKSSNGWDNW